MQKSEKKLESPRVKKDYVSPNFDVIYVEMEKGIAAGSASASPLISGGVVSNISTEWENHDDSTIETDWLSK